MVGGEEQEQKSYNRNGNWVFLISESENVSCSVVSDSLQPHGLEPIRLLCPWNSLSMEFSQARILAWVAISFS